MKGTIIQIKHGVGKVRSDDGKIYKFNRRTHGNISQGRRLQRVEFPGDGDWTGKTTLLEEFETPSSSSEPEQQPNRQGEQDGYRFLNPYNFVRNIDAPRPKGELLGNAAPMPHDRYTGISGTITCSLTNTTPLFVSDSHDVDGKTEAHRSFRFFKAWDDQNNLIDAIPATSLRGMVRSVFEAATNSCYGVFGDSRLDHRDASLPKGLIPARVISVDEKGAKLELLDCSKMENRVMPAGSWTVYRDKVLKRVHGREMPFDRSRSIYPMPFKDGERVAALVETRPRSKTRTLRNGKTILLYKFYRVIKVVKKDKASSLIPDSNSKVVYGYIHTTGANIENKHDERLFFRWDDDKSPDLPSWEELKKLNTPQRKVTTSVQSRTVREYNLHLKEYWDRNRGQVKKLNGKGKPWPINAGDLPHPSSFVAENKKLSVGDLVYYIPDVPIVETGMHIQFPILRPVLISRKPYQYEIGAYIDETTLHHCKTYNALCPACRTFGWVYQPKEDQKVEELPDITAYAGRVRFCHALLKDDCGRLDEIQLSILGNPKPTTTQFYLLDSNGKADDPTVDFNTPNAKLRGRKFYRHHTKVSPKEYSRVPKNGQPQKDDKNRTIKDAFQPGAKFTFSLDFENLQPEELGALLFALQLEEGLYHRLGYGKPLGFGSVNIEIDGIEIIDWEQRLKSWELNEGKTSVGKEEIQDWISKKIKLYQDKMTDFYEEKYALVLDDLQSLLGEPPDIPIHYPRPSENPDPDGKNFEWFVGNKERIKGKKHWLDSPVVLPLASDDTQGLPIIKKDGTEPR